ncbi:aminomethyltransferase (plasmid) [Rhodococcus erythropolis R138]|uniref:aminomethyltransferase family protein n=1 Tax=Rhodococcus erythropolis TaxID=1833 RepID=UPI0004928821|nr:aminomethyltransferase family protein [Rhodococcus erythropolis]ALU73456.1 aminomethyltransferase [Rhodococcus erythropolis R138]
MSIDNVPVLVDVPAYPDVPTYTNLVGGLHIWEGDGWKEESLSWKIGTYLASNLSGPQELTLRGPGAQEFLSRLSINNVYKWKVGTSKHLVMLDDNGYIATHGLSVRDNEDTFRHLASWPWPIYKAESTDLDVELTVRNIFLIQVAGPTSLQVLERLLGEQVRDVAFLAIKDVTVPGIGEAGEVELSRIGMAGTLAYELRGPLELGPRVFDAVYQAGQGLGIKRSGWRTYVVNHTEGGFPQISCTFLPSVYEDDGFMTHPQFSLFGNAAGSERTGSVDHQDLRARFRTPFEANWGWMAKFDHEFIGRAALEAEAVKPPRKTVTLRWNKEDVVDVFRSQFEPGEEYRNFEFPTTPQSPAGGHADLVTIDGKPVGVSSTAVYSYFYREMISHSTIDLDKAEIGTEVVVHWGEFGKRIKPVRATVERFPYLDLPSNKDYDIDSVPSGVTSTK